MANKYKKGNFLKNKKAFGGFTPGDSTLLNNQGQGVTANLLTPPGDIASGVDLPADAMGGGEGMDLGASSGDYGALLSGAASGLSKFSDVFKEKNNRTTPEPQKEIIGPESSVNVETEKVKASGLRTAGKVLGNISGIDPMTKFLTGKSVSDRLGGDQYQFNEGLEKATEFTDSVYEVGLPIAMEALAPGSGKAVGAVQQVSSSMNASDMEQAPMMAMGGDIHSNNRVLRDGVTPIENSMDMEMQVRQHLLSQGLTPDAIDEYLATPKGQAVKNMFRNSVSSYNTEIIPEQMKYGGNMKKYNMGGELTEFNAGGTHEENPMGGVPQGTEALVEEGETKFNAEDFIYSDRLKVDKKLAEEFSLPKKAIGKSFADVSKMLVDKDRPNDPISKRAAKKDLENLATAQEAFKSVKMEEANEMYSSQMAYGGKMKYPEGGRLNLEESDPFLGYGDNINMSAELAGMQPTDNIKSPGGTKPNVIPGMNAMRYAPLFTDLVAMNTLRRNRTPERDLGMFDSQTQITPQLINREQLQRGVTNQAATTRRQIEESSGGNAAALMASQVASGIGSQRVAGEVDLATQSADAQEMARVQSQEASIEQQDIARRMSVMDINDRDKAMYLSSMIDSMTNFGQNLGLVGQEQQNIAMVNEMFGYDIYGQYKQGKDSGKVKGSFSDFLKSQIPA